MFLQDFINVKDTVSIISTDPPCEYEFTKLY